MRAGAAGVEVVVHAVGEGGRVTLGAPSLLGLTGGRLLVAFEQRGPGVKDLAGSKGHEAKGNRWVQGRVMVSGDGGETWRLSGTYPFCGGSLFRDGGDVYLAGEADGALVMMRSPDGGGSWSAPRSITERMGLRGLSTRVTAWGGWWWLAVQVARGDGGWGNQVFRAKCGASLVNRKAWRAGPAGGALASFLPVGGCGGTGVPHGGGEVRWRDLVLVGVPAGAQGWMPGGGLKLLGATDCGRCNWCAFLEVGEGGELGVQRVGGGDLWCWLPVPGGHAKFELFFDEGMKCFVGVGQREVVAMGPGGMGGRLGAWVSENLVDWTYLGDPMGGGEGFRWGGAAVVAGGELCTACRYGAGGAGGRGVRATEIRFKRANFGRWGRG